MHHPGTTVTLGTRHASQYIDLIPSSENAQKGEDQRFFELDELFVGDDEVGQTIGVHSLHQEGIVSTTARHQHTSARSLTFNDSGNLNGHMFHESAHEVTSLRPDAVSKGLTTDSTHSRASDGRTSSV